MEPTEHEIYPMMLFPTFEVHDIEASVEWYTRVLGFSPVYIMRDPDGRTHLAHLRRLKHQDILLVPQQGRFENPGAGVTITLAFSAESVDKIAELNTFAARIADAGAAIEGPLDRPWNTRDVVVHDPDGYRLVFTTPDFARMRDFEATMRGVREGLSKT